MWVRLLVVAVATVGASACVIGPKQDDPATLTDNGPDDGSLGADTDRSVPSEDTATGVFSDSAGGGADTTVGDTTFVPPMETGCATDAADAGDAADAEETRCGEDGGGDAVSDG